MGSLDADGSPGTGDVGAGAQVPSGPSALTGPRTARDDGVMETTGVTSAGLTELAPEESYALLATVPVGRVVFTDRALPAIQPVNFALDGPDVVFRTAAGSKLAVAVSRAVVAFEADSFDAEARSGWSVVLVGRTYEVTDPAERGRLLALPLETFVPGERDRVVKVVPRIVTGRRIVR